MSIGRTEHMQAQAAALLHQQDPLTAPTESIPSKSAHAYTDRGRQLVRVGASLIGLAAAYATGYTGLWQFNTQSGVIDGPTAPHARQPTAFERFDGIGQFNIKHNAEGTWPSIDRLIRQHRVGVLIVQEATGNDVRILRERIPYMYHTTVKTDGNQRVLDGGSGQHILTAQRPTKIITRSIDGTGLLAGMIGMPIKGVLSLVEGESFAAGAGDARQEMRAAVGMTVPLGVGDKRHEDQIFASHLAGRGVSPGLHNRQRARFVNFIQDKQASNKRVVVIGDLNSGNAETAEIARQLGHTHSKTDPTHTDGKQTPDRVTYRAFQTGTAKVVKTKGSDHNALVFRFNDR